MQDAALFYADKVHKPTVELPNRFVLCTVHRAENTDDVQKSIGNHLHANASGLALASSDMGGSSLPMCLTL